MFLGGVTEIVIGSLLLSHDMNKPPNIIVNRLCSFSMLFRLIINK
jgi:hypothetical protein